MDDPLVTLKFSPRYLYGSSIFSRSALSNAKKVQDPILIVQGDSDNAALPEGAKMLLEALPPKDKTLKIIQGADHILMSDPSQRKQVMSTVSD